MSEFPTLPYICYVCVGVRQPGLYPTEPELRATVDRILFFDIGTLYKSLVDYFVSIYKQNSTLASGYIHTVCVNCQIPTLNTDFSGYPINLRAGYRISALAGYRISCLIFGLIPDICLDIRPDIGYPSRYPS